MILLFLSTLLVGLTLDAVWLWLIMASFYKKKIGYLFGPVQWWAVIAFYLLFSAGLIYFSITPSIKEQSLFKAWFSGSFLGLLCYATYNLTNNALIAQWPIQVTLIDTVWGTIFGGLTSTIIYLLFK